MTAAGLIMADVGWTATISAKARTAATKVEAIAMALVIDRLG
jgi:hypothetical protein